MAASLLTDSRLPIPTISINLVDMPELGLVFLAGFLASFVDGALGMGFGPTSSTVLLGTGLAPAAVSSTVNLAKVATGITAAIAHWRFDNIDRTLVRRLAVPGCFGAVVGVTVLANVDGDDLRPVLALLLLVVAGRILVKFSAPLRSRSDDGDDAPADIRGVTVAAGAGGVTNGLIGAWGPVVTPFLLGRGVVPRVAIGSVNTAEVAVAVVASGSLLASVGGGGIDVGTVVAMLAGGVIAAPIAAWSIKFIPARGLGVAVGTMLFAVNVRELAGHFDVGAARWPAYAAVVAGAALAACRPHLAQRRQVQPAL